MATVPNDRQDHTVHFIGDYPCDKNGSKITAIQHTTNTHELIPGLSVNHMFSNKPQSGYANYYEKMTTYASIISHPAIALDPNVTPKIFPAIASEGEDSVFRYVDTSSSRAGIAAVMGKLNNHKVAIVGLGGTGAYILDLLAKTNVGEIHLYDGDDFQQHNAFRAPGAAPIEDIEARLKKVEYYTRVYSRMHKHVIPHPHFVDSSNVEQIVASAGFAFLSLDNGRAKRIIIERLHTSGVPFIDCGMGIYEVEGMLAGIVRTTTSTSNKKDHVIKHVHFTDDESNEYTTNIQIADINALNAALAVIKWKKLCGFYVDLENEHHTTYTINGNTITNEEFP